MWHAQSQGRASTSRLLRSSVELVASKMATCASAAAANAALLSIQWTGVSRQCHGKSLHTQWTDHEPRSDTQAMKWWQPCAESAADALVKFDKFTALGRQLACPEPGLHVVQGSLQRFLPDLHGLLHVQPHELCVTLRSPARPVQASIGLQSRGNMVSLMRSSRAARQRTCDTSFCHICWMSRHAHNRLVLILTNGLLATCSCKICISRAAWCQYTAVVGASSCSLLVAQSIQCSKVTLKAYCVAVVKEGGSLDFILVALLSAI